MTRARKQSLKKSRNLVSRKNNGRNRKVNKITRKQRGGQVQQSVYKKAYNTYLNRFRNHNNNNKKIKEENYKYIPQLDDDNMVHPDFRQAIRGTNDFLRNNERKEGQIEIKEGDRFHVYKYNFPEYGYLFVFNIDSKEFGIIQYSYLFKDMKEYDDFLTKKFNHTYNTLIGHTPRPPVHSGYAKLNSGTGTTKNNIRSFEEPEYAEIEGVDGVEGVDGESEYAEAEGVEGVDEGSEYAEVEGVEGEAPPPVLNTPIPGTAEGVEAIKKELNNLYVELIQIDTDNVKYNGSINEFKDEIINNIGFFEKLLKRFG
jgi:hypothetical protein